MKKLERIFKALGDANRLRIIKMLEIGPLCHCEIQEVLHLAASTTSKHLGLLREAGLIEDQRQGKWVYYRLATEPPLPALRDLLQSWGNETPQIQADKAVLDAQKNQVSCR